MAVPQRNANVVALFPLQETIWDKDGTGALGSGVVSFFSDPLFSVPKDVYQETDDPVTGDVTYVNLGSVLILSGIGSFVDGNGHNFIPMLYPYEGAPTDTVVGDFEPYYITVYNSSGIFQFSTNDWPPNTFSQSGSTQAQEALTPNLITNPQFSVVSFIPDPATGKHIYTVSGTESNFLAPGWTLETEGTGTVTVSQLSLSASIPSEAPYALQLEWSTGLTELRVVQQLTNSPRIIAGSNASASLVIASPTGDDVNVQIHYIAPAPTAIDVLIVDDDTTGTSTYTTISGTEAIPATNAQTADGYVNFVIDIQSLASSSSIDITSAQLVAVETSSIIADYIQQTTQENLNGLMWYYEPLLAYKPITNYLIGWDFKNNPDQAGAISGTSGLGDNLSRYIADQTISFESVGNVMTFTLSNGGLGFTTTSATQFAIIQYLPTSLAYELLEPASENSLAVQLSGGSNSSLQGYVNLYWTNNASLPDITSGSNLSVVTSLTAGVPTVASGWTLLDNTNAESGHVPFVLNGVVNLNGWDTSGLVIGGVQWFAVVISFKEVPTTAADNINYVTLCAGSIATKPAPMNDAQTLQALQYYYESSYPLGIAPGTASTAGVVAVQKITPVNENPAKLIPAYFSIPFMAPKVAAPTMTFYSPNSGTAANVYGIVSQNGANAATADIAITNWTAVSVNTKCATYSPNTATGFVSTGAITIDSTQAYIEIQYTADSRLGTF